MTQLDTDLAAVQALLTTSGVLGTPVDAASRPVAFDDPRAVKWDLLGAVGKVCASADRSDSIRRMRACVAALRAAVPVEESLVAWDVQPGRAVADAITLVAGARTVAAMSVAVGP